MSEQRRTILEAVVGSTVHGTNVQDGLEDLDLMAVVIENRERVLGFHQEDCWVTRTKPEGVRSEAGDVDHTAYGLRKYLGLALKGNPTILLLLFAPPSAIRIMTAEGAELRRLTPHIVSKQVYSPFRGYMRQQHERLLGLRGQRNVTRPELVEAYGYDTKYAGHIIRLGFQGEEILLTGKLSLPMRSEQCELVRAVRSGKYSLAEVSNMIIAAEERIEAAVEASTLPESPNRKKVQDWMIATYLRHWATDYNDGAEFPWANSGAERRAEGTTRAGGDVDHSGGQGDSRGESETPSSVGVGVAGQGSGEA